MLNCINNMKDPRGNYLIPVDTIICYDPFTITGFYNSGDTQCGYKLLIRALMNPVHHHTVFDCQLTHFLSRISRHAELLLHLAQVEPREYKDRV